MTCPKCQSQEFIRFRGPQLLKKMIFRRHKCMACKTIFLSAQFVVNDAAAERLLAMLERLETSPRGTSSSSGTPE